MKTTRAKAKEDRQRQWAEVMRERAESGERIKAYCERRGIQPNTYYYWQRKLREAAIEEMTTTIELPAPRGWAAAVRAETGAEIESQTLTVEIGQYRVHVGADAEERLLARVCRTLAAIC